MTEYPVIQRDTAAKYPDFMDVKSGINGRNMPCCYQKPRSTTVVIEPKEDETYILQSDSKGLPAKRLAYITPELLTLLGLKSDYETSTKKNRLLTDHGDVFRMGLGRPSKTLPLYLDDDTPILRPRDAKDNVIKCSFYRTWKDTKPGDDPILQGIDHAYQEGTLSILDELEYVTTFLKAEVIRINTESNDVMCGFWSDILSAKSRTIVLLDNDILGFVERRRQGTRTYKTKYTTDIVKGPLKAAYSVLREAHTKACSIAAPVFNDAIQELLKKGKPDYQVILDPFQRIQAIFIPREIILPIQPTTQQAFAGIPVRDSYANISTDELPTAANARAFLSDTLKYKLVKEHRDVGGRIVEFEVTAGFRFPIQPEEPPSENPASEVWHTAKNELELVTAQPNAKDIRLAQEIAYGEEIYQFIMFSLSKDIAAGEDYGDLRDAIQSRSPDLLKALKAWYTTNAYDDATQSPIEFVNKVRTPCGQYTSKDTCNKSSLCGWHNQTCRIRVKPLVDKDSVLKRVAKTLRENDKQRALVLDAALSPFFSTVLYLEMPHEWITSSV